MSTPSANLRRAHEKRWFALRAAVAREVRDALRAEGVSHWQRRPDRYLIWLQWSRELRVPLRRAVSFLVRLYRRKLEISGPALGVSLETLTSSDAFDALREGLARSEGPLVSPGPPGETHGQYRRRVGSRRQYVAGGGRRFRGSASWDAQTVRRLLTGSDRDG